MNKDQLERQNLLLKVLFDPHASDAERDDAAMDLGFEFDNDVVLSKLKQAIFDFNKDEYFIDSCAESIGEIWIKRNAFDLELYNKFPKEAQASIFNVIKHNKSNWLKEFNIKDPYLRCF